VAPSRLPLEAKDVPARTLWYGLYTGGTKSGWASESLERVSDGPEVGFVSSQAIHLDTQSMGQRVLMDLSVLLRFDADPPFRLRRGAFVAKQPQGDSRIEVARGEDGFVATVTVGGASREVAVGELDYTLADLLTIERWIRAEPRVAGESLTARAFDIQQLSLDLETITVTGAKTTILQGVETSVYDVTTSFGRRGEFTARVDAKGTRLSQNLGMMELRLEPEETAKRVETGAHVFTGADLFYLATVPVEGRIAPTFQDVRRVTELVLRVRGEAAGTIRQAPRQTVAKEEGTGAVLLRLGGAHGERSEATAQEIRAALADTAEYPTRHPKVVELARTAVGGTADPREKVRRLLAFVSEYLADELCPHIVPVEALLETRRGDCSEHSLLFTALARAAGIPAREVHGLMYMGDALGRFGGHAWNEVALDGEWVSVDAQNGSLEPDATHVALSRAGRALDMAATTGRLSFEVVSVVPPPPAPATPPAKEKPPRGVAPAR
jgi:hypothetical protein